MKVFVATEEGQGQRESDFCHVPEGELVCFTFACDTDKDDIDGSCGCRRSMNGVDCLRGTTTFKVADLPMTEKAYRKRLLDSFDKMGYAPYLKERTIQAMITELLELASKFPEGRVLERRSDYPQVRRKYAGLRGRPKETTRGAHG